MPRTILAANTVVGGYPTAGVTITATAADTANQNRTLHTGKEIIIARNSGASTRTVTITSLADSQQGRTGNIAAENILAGVIKTFGPFALDGWKQTDGYIYFESNHAEVLFSVIRV